MLFHITLSVSFDILTKDSSVKFNAMKINANLSLFLTDYNHEDASLEFQIELSGPPHAPATLPSGKELLVARG
jgi:hypothetical protein